MRDWILLTIVDVNDRLLSRFSTRPVPGAGWARAQLGLAALGFDFFLLAFDRFPDTSDLELFATEALPQFQ